MSVNVRVYGDKLDLADELADEFHDEAAKAVTDGAKILLAESHRLIARWGPNAPAPAGQTPATITGDLLRLTRLRRGRVRRNSRVAQAAVQYAPHSWLVEFGHINVDGTRTLPRPFVRPAVENTEADIDRLLTERLS
jgi:hypothetical protein